MRLDDVVDIPSRGLVLIVSFVEPDANQITKLKRGEWNSFVYLNGIFSDGISME